MPDRRVTNTHELNGWIIMNPENGRPNSDIGRRFFFSRIAVAAATASGLGASLRHPHALAYQNASALLDNSEADSEEYWLAVKQQFSLRPGLIALNAANLCPSPQSVTHKLFERTRDIDSDPSFENRHKYEQIKENTRLKLANMLRVGTDEIAITRNTSESNRTVIDGLNLQAGDEVILWDQNHESNNVAWDVWSKRCGFSVKRVSTPDSPTHGHELANPFLHAMGSRTRVVSFSHVSNISGVALPAKTLCRSIRSRGALSMVDGAQTFGMAPQDLQAMGCDFYTGSAHKWLCGPRETGVLYVRNTSQALLWPPTVSHDWEKARHQGAQKFDNLGQRDDGRLEALATAIEFYDAVGGQRIEARIRAHVDQLMQGLHPLTDQLQFSSPSPPELRAGIVIFTFVGRNASDTMKMLYGNFNISAMAADVGGRTLVRFAPHIYNTPEELDTAISAVHALLRN